MPAASEIQSRIISALSHDVLASVRHVALYADAISDERKDPDAVDKYASRLVKKSEELTEMVLAARLLAQTATHQPKPQEIVLSHLAQELGIPCEPGVSDASAAKVSCDVQMLHFALDAFAKLYPASQQANMLQLKADCIMMTLRAAPPSDDADAAVDAVREALKLVVDLAVAAHKGSNLHEVEGRPLATIHLALIQPD